MKKDNHDLQKGQIKMGRKKIFKNYFPRMRVHHLVIYMFDKNGKLYMTEEQLQKCISAHEGGYASFAYVLHDMDSYDAEAVYQHGEKNRKTFIERLRILSDAKGLPKDETTESGYAHDEELEKKAQEYADACFPSIAVNQKKPAHWHVILTFTDARELDAIARWFKGLNGETLEPNYNEGKSGKGAAESAWLYLVHAHHPKKHQYDKAAVVASFDYETQIEDQIALEERHSKYHIDADIFNDVIEEVANGLPLKEAMKKVSSPVYFQRQQIFERARKYYVMNVQPMPPHRQVYYIESDGLDADHGKGGLGKTACAHALAKQLAAQYGADITKPVSELNDFIYIAGDAKVFLQEYDGQPILIINEINGQDFKRACKGVNGVKELLDPFPERKALDKKHGSVVCTAKYIIMNGIQSFNAFLKDLAASLTVDGVTQASEESVQEQFERRIWAVIRLIQDTVSVMRSDYMELKVNRGLFENTPEQRLLTSIGIVRANFQQIRSQTSGEAQYQIEGQVLEPLTKRIKAADVAHSVKKKITKPEELPDHLLRMGEIVDENEVYPPMDMEEWEAIKAEEERKQAEWRAKYYDDDDEPLPF